MNLVFIQKSTGRGGAKNSLAESLQAISRDGEIQAEVIVGEPGPFVDRCTALGVPTTITQLPEWRKLFDRLRFSNAMKRHASTSSSTRSACRWRVRPTAPRSTGSWSRSRMSVAGSLLWEARRA